MKTIISSQSNVFDLYAQLSKCVASSQPFSTFGGGVSAYPRKDGIVTLVRKAIAPPYWVTCLEL